MQQFENWFQASLTADLAQGATTVTVDDASALSLTGSDHYMAVLFNANGDKEIIQIDGISANVLTIVRGQEGSTDQAFATDDQIEIRLTKGTLDGFFQRVELLDEDDMATDSALVPASQQSIKAYINDHAYQPTGMISAWNPGYFTATANGGTYTDVLGNTVAGANTYLNPYGWYVCDGTELELTGTPIFNAAGRFLPDLTDSRFLQGSTVAGAVGGSNTMVNHNHSASAGTIYISTSGGHKHRTPHRNMVGGSDVTNLASYQGTNYGSASATRSVSTGRNYYTDTVSHSHSNAYFYGYVGNGAADPSANTTENRPLYLNCFYIIKAI